MKRLIIFLVAISFFAISSAQNYTATAVSHVMNAGVTYYEYTPTAAQYIGGAATLGYDTLYFEILANKNTPTNCNVRVEVSSRAGSTDTYDIDLQGKIFENGTYAAIAESAANTATKELSDTTRFSLADCSKFYRYYRVIVNDDNDCATTDSLIIGKVIFKLYER